MGRSSPAVVLAAAAILMMVAASSGRIEYGEEDLSSKEALWALYQRWSVVYNVNRQPAEKARRFEIFKQNARRIHDFNKKGNASYTRALNLFGDMTTDEVNNQCACLTHE
jgi:KDEL-tailed cysteine endopeptidase